MAQKSVKKAPVKKTAAAKKAAPKKAVRASRIIEEEMIVDAPEMHHPHHEHMAHPHHEHACGCGSACACHGNRGGCQCGGGCWGFIKKLFWFFVIFALGFVACMCVCRYGHHGHKGPKMPVEFVNGCLDVSKIKCAEFAQRVMVADVNNDNCISREEYRAFKKQMRAIRK